MHLVGGVPLAGRGAFEVGDEGRTLGGQVLIIAQREVSGMIGASDRGFYGGLETCFPKTILALLAGNQRTFRGLLKVSTITEA